ncbi:MAG: glutathione transferase GstA [Sphingomicrobium sp.]
MKLYYSPGACSQAPHIILHEAGLDHDAERVDLKEKRTETGKDYLAVNPKGAVPALELDDGEILTENAVVLQYLGDRSGSGLIPPPGDFSRYRVLEWLNFITTELHKSFGPLFSPDAGHETKDFFKKLIAKKLDYVEERLGDGPFLMGKTLTLPDAYLFVMTSWTDKIIGLDRWPNLTAFRNRMLERPSVRHVLRFEGLLEEEPAD